MSGKKGMYFMNGNLSHVKCSISDKVATVIVDNPPVNALTREVKGQLSQVLDAITIDPEVKVVIITGNGERFFMAGADIKELARVQQGPREVAETLFARPKIFDVVYAFPKPIIAAINGQALGGGCELALACDLRIAAEHATLGLPEIKLGLLPGGGGTQRLIQLIGEAKAKEMMFTGEPIPADQALGIGLINHVVPGEKLLSTAQNLAAKIARLPSEALQSIKRVVNDTIKRILDAGLDEETSLFIDLLFSPNAIEGVRSFIEKRPPNFL